MSPKYPRRRPRPPPKPPLDRHPWRCPHHPAPRHPPRHLAQTHPQIQPFHICTNILAEGPASARKTPPESSSFAQARPCTALSAPVTSLKHPTSSPPFNVAQISSPKALPLPEKRRLNRHPLRKRDPAPRYLPPSPRSNTPPHPPLSMSPKYPRRRPCLCPTKRPLFSRHQIFFQENCQKFSKIFIRLYPESARAAPTARSLHTHLFVNKS